MNWIDSVGLWFIGLGAFAIAAQLKIIAEWIAGKRTSEIDDALKGLQETIRDMVDKKVKEGLGFGEDGNPK